MRKTITAAIAALTLGGALMASTAPAAAAGYGGHGYYGGGYGGYRHGGYGGGYDAGPAIFAGIAGLAVGAALADSHPRYYGPGPGYYEPGYAYRPYGTCYAGRQVWDPYIGRYVYQRTPYAC